MSTVEQQLELGGRILVTGAAGFVGSHTSRALVSRGDAVLGIDNLNNYYCRQLKLDRLQTLEGLRGFQFRPLDITDTAALKEVVESFRPTVIINLAAQVGIRNSLENPEAYITDNLVGFANILEVGRRCGVEQIIYASSSSVYGANSVAPYSTHDAADHPINLYAATKRANELMAHAYSSLYALPTTGLRFFTVYGPWGRPDMAIFSFAESIAMGRPIDVYGDGEQRRDFTYVDDIVRAIVALVDKPAVANENWHSGGRNLGTSPSPWQVLNIGCGKQVPLNRVIELLEAGLGRKAIRNQLPPQNGDMLLTQADVSDLQSLLGLKPEVSIEEGLARFVSWFEEYRSTNVVDLRDRLTSVDEDTPDAARASYESRAARQ